MGQPAEVSRRILRSDRRRPRGSPFPEIPTWNRVVHGGRPIVNPVRNHLRNCCIESSRSLPVRPTRVNVESLPMVGPVVDAGDLGMLSTCVSTSVNPQWAGRPRHSSTVVLRRVVSPRDQDSLLTSCANVEAAIVKGVRRCRRHTRCVPRRRPTRGPAVFHRSTSTQPGDAHGDVDAPGVESAPHWSGAGIDPGDAVKGETRRPAENE